MMDSQHLRHWKLERLEVMTKRNTRSWRTLGAAGGLLKWLEDFWSGWRTFGAAGGLLERLEDFWSGWRTDN